VKLEELLVEESWLEALSGEFQKSYVVNLAKFVETEICSRDDYIYPPQHLIFNALNTKVVKTGPVQPVQPGIIPMAGLSS
jgi:uracil-DNA glycosylase